LQAKAIVTALKMFANDTSTNKESFNMAKIEISNLTPAGSDLFADADSFLTELQATDTTQIIGGKGKSGKGKGYGYGGGKSGYGYGYGYGGGKSGYGYGYGYCH
jgi:hypothetical protein